MNATRRASITGLVLLAACCTAKAQPVPTSPSTQWTPAMYAAITAPDRPNDQQTGSSEGDIVGDIWHPSLFMCCSNDASLNPATGSIGFRMRLAADTNPHGFDGVALVGLDANLDGGIDLFLGVSNQGSMDGIGIWRSGPGLNRSPKTTSLLTPSLRSYSETPANYSWLAVSSETDPEGKNRDLDGAGKTDYFLTFILPFADIAAALETEGIIGFTKDSTFTLVAATASQQNKINQDINGVAGGVNSDLPWSSLGAMSLPFSFAAMRSVPEPNPLAFAVFGLLLAVLRTKPHQL